MIKANKYLRFDVATPLVLLLWSSSVFAQGAERGPVVGPASGASGAEAPRVPWDVPTATLLIIAALIVAAAVVAFVLRSNRYRSNTTE